MKDEGLGDTKCGMWIEVNIPEEQLKAERQKARELRKSRWWQNKLQDCRCHYCQTPLVKAEVTMDHILPISRGGKSTKGNVVPACKTCNAEKKLMTPVEWEEYLAKK